jgi:hypothetical protein
MLDALKFAFEILIVAALALPWLAVLIRMFPSDLGAALQFDLSFLPKPAQDAVTVTLVIALGYLLGSAVERISRSFFNDELWLIVPTEHQIRENVYNDVYCQDHLLSKLSLPLASPGKPSQSFALCLGTVKEDTPKKFNTRVEDLFRLQEGAVLLEGQDKVERLKEYYDQITVLRGAAFNGFLLFAVCAFGACGNLRARWSGHGLLRWLTFAPAGFMAAWGCVTLWNKLHETSHSLYSHPPLADSIFILVGVTGFFVIARAEKPAAWLRLCLVAAIVTLASFAGWWWTEIMYDLQVIHSQPQLVQDAASIEKVK